MAQTRLAVLDGLRGIAVLLVLWYHVWEITWLPAPLPQLQFIPETGFAGVDLFFFISGFVIVYPFVKALVNGEAAPAWGHFAYRRAIKIVPSYVLSIVLCIAVGYAHFDSARQAFDAIVTHLLFIHTWFPDTYGAINGVLWTLAVEVEFYVLFPLIWMFFKRAPWIAAGVLIAASIAYRSYAVACCLHTNAPLLVDNLPGYLDTFAFGMLAAHIYVTRRETWTGPGQKALATAAALAGFALLAYLLHALWDVRTHADWPTFCLPLNRAVTGASFALMALGSLLGARAWQRIVANRVLLFFAVISYNLYLYHQVLARLLLKWRVPPFRGPSEHSDPHWQVTYTMVAFAAAIAQAALFTYLFERPLLRLPPQWWQARLARLRGLRAPTGM